MIKRCLLGLVYFYQKFISPSMSARCRYYPTCSEYGRQALVWHDTKKGAFLVLKRVLSCHPWGGSGVDFVPVPMYLYRYDVFFAPSRNVGFGVFVDEFGYVSRLNWLMRR
ncbi:membrane protein insertion efficiency factor YidD [Moraxella sp. Pampa]|uniref:membrane protein insertion efficiency factor YidD n=1 Tax=Moraxella sp. Pampa TaxID=3111978 RepID=UPI002B4013E2|nr:membrane protein insertion efficiency factor YidD [Moraxella sp. Pampa]